MNLIQPLMVLVAYGTLVGLAFIARLDYRNKPRYDTEQ